MACETATNRAQTGHQASGSVQKASHASRLPTARQEGHAQEACASRPPARTESGTLLLKLTQTAARLALRRARRPAVVASAESARDATLRTIARLGSASTDGAPHRRRALTGFWTAMRLVLTAEARLARLARRLPAARVTETATLATAAHPRASASARLALTAVRMVGRPESTAGDLRDAAVARWEALAREDPTVSPSRAPRAFALRRRALMELRRRMRLRAETAGVGGAPCAGLACLVRHRPSALASASAACARLRGATTDCSMDPNRTWTAVPLHPGVSCAFRESGAQAALLAWVASAFRVCARP